MSFYSSDEEEEEKHEGQGSSNNPIVSRDPINFPIDEEVRRSSAGLIADMLRTGYCVLGSVFLVEGIERRVSVDEDDDYYYDHDDDHHHADVDNLNDDKEKEGNEESREDGLAGKIVRREKTRGTRKSRSGSGRRSRSRRRRRAVRLILGDGELCVQALLRPEAHWLVDRDLVWEGCYVRCDKFELGFVGGGGGGGDHKERGEGRGDGGEPGKEKEAYLLVGDMETVGWNRDYLRMLGVEEPKVGDDGNRGRSETHVFNEQEAEEEEDGVDMEAAGGEDEMEESPEMDKMETEAERLIRLAGEEMVQDPSGLEDQLDQLGYEDGNKKSRTPGNQERKPQTVARQSVSSDTKRGPEGYISDSDDEAFEALEISIERALARRATLQTQQSHPTPSPPAPPPAPPAPPPPPPPPPQQHQKRAAPPPPPAPAPRNADERRPWMSDDPTQPLKLTPLGKIPTLPYKQNWMVNVLAVVVSLSEVESCTIPPYIQRTARLADPSTTKQVHLTVFLEPHEFLPKVGSVVMLIGVKNHRFDGGSLKKYVSDRLKSGRSWWIQRPEDLGWCEEEVERLKGWWGAKTVEEVVEK